MKTLLLREILSFVAQTKPKTIFNLRHTETCPAAQAGKVKFGDDFVMIGHTLGAYGQVRVSVPKTWGAYTRGKYMTRREDILAQFKITL